MSFSLRKLEEKGAVKARHHTPTHGVHAYLNSGTLPSGRAWKRAQVEISELRLALIAQYGGEKIQPAVLTLIESAIESLMIQRLSSLYVKKAGVMRRDSLKRGNLELHSVLSGQFLAYGNHVRLNLEAAARMAKGAVEGSGETLADIIRESDQAQAEKAASAGNQAGSEEVARPDANGEAVGPKDGPGSDPEAAQDEEDPDFE